MTAMRRYFPTLLLACSLIGAQAVLWTGHNGILDYVEIRRDLRESVAHNASLGERNRRLVEDVVELKSRDDAVEEIARRSLGMIRAGETFYRVIER